MRAIQATEAKARLANVLRIVEAGETVAITRHGKTIAHIVPAAVNDRSERLVRINHFKSLRKQWSKSDVSAQEAMSWRHEEHRH